ncbi:MAG TPA: alpha/beta hydrolase [Pseudonocardiaceae bacterium]|jgi:pimeloyl-ACP methyl ester carboxylesterase|nr:alpha/beta hydrolase [Pseudonocardiaceae bacterium]
MAYVAANGIRMHVQRMPAKGLAPEVPRPRVVFIHGVGTDSLASFYLTLAAPAANAGIDVISYDLRGHGRSDRPPTGYTVADAVDDLTALLVELQVDGPVHLVGNSFGGTVAFSFAQRFPERVASLVAIESEPATESWSRKIADRLGEGAEKLVQADVLSWIQDHHGSHMSRLGKAFGQVLATTTITRDVPRGPLLNREDLAAIRCPVLAVFGAESHVVDVADTLPGLLPGCRVEIIPGYEHGVLMQAPQVVRDLVLPWILRHEPAEIR